MGSKRAEEALEEEENARQAVLRKAREKRAQETKSKEEVKPLSDVDVDDSDDDDRPVRSKPKSTTKTVDTKKPTGPADLVRGKPKKKKAWEEEENSDDDEEDAEVTHEDIEKWIQNEKNREKEEAEA